METEKVVVTRYAYRNWDSMKMLLMDMMLFKEANEGVYDINLEGEFLIVRTDEETGRKMSNKFPMRSYYYDEETEERYILTEDDLKPKVVERIKSANDAFGNDPLTTIEF